MLYLCYDYNINATINNYLLILGMYYLNPRKVHTLFLGTHLLYPFRF